MPHDTVQQAIVRGAVGRIRKQIGGQQPTGDPFQDRNLTLSNEEIALVLSVCDEFIRVPADPGPPQDPLRGT